RNLPTVHVLPYSDVSAYHILWSDVVVIESPAIGQSLEPVADTEPAPRVKVKREAPERREPAKAKKAAKKAAPKKAEKKAPAKKKPAAKAAPKKPAKAAPKKAA